jgi:NTE family protein
VTSPGDSRLTGPGFGLALGGGGTVGLAYHVGVLRALEVEAGVFADDASVIVGTSAGSAIAAYLRSGWTTAQLWEMVGAAQGLPPGPDAGPPAVALEGTLPAVARVPRMFTAAFRTPLQLARRTLGSAYVLSRAMLRTPAPSLPAPIRRAFPGGLFVMTEGRRRFREELPTEWPARPTWLCTVDIVSGQRVVLGRPKPPHLSLPQAVTASCAIPGVYPPVRFGRRELIDGGAHSSTNLDVLGPVGCTPVLCVAPMAFDASDGPCLLGRATRAWASRTLAGEVDLLRRSGAAVAVIAPRSHEVRLHGLNLMRSGDLMPVAEAAYEATAAMLGTDGVRRALIDSIARQPRHESPVAKEA